jgi:hypothetical protein
MVFNVWTLDNSFNIRINGTYLTTPNETEYFSAATSNSQVEFLDGTMFPGVWTITGSQVDPIIRMVVSKTGTIKLYGSRTSGGALEEMRLRSGSFNTINLNANSTNTFQVGQQVNGQTFITGDYGTLNEDPTNCDSDGDGVSNNLDLDSDGDGCPDAKEAGVNGTLTNGTIINTTNNASSGAYSTTGVANAIAVGPYGINGLANGVETSVDAGTISYTNNYNRYALDKNINFCIDSDGDGVSDAVDIDDDNDGIRDYIEQGSCPVISSTGLTFTGSTNSVRFNGNSISAASTSNGAWQTAYSNQSLALPIHLEFRDNGLISYEMIGLQPVNGTKTLANYNDDAYKIYFNTRLGLDNQLSRILSNKAKSNPKRIVFAAIGQGGAHRKVEFNFRFSAAGSCRYLTSIC